MQALLSPVWQVHRKCAKKDLALICVGTRGSLPLILRLLNLNSTDSWHEVVSLKLVLIIKDLL